MNQPVPPSVTVSTHYDFKTNAHEIITRIQYGSAIQIKCHNMVSDEMLHKAYSPNDIIADLSKDIAHQATGYAPWFSEEWFCEAIYKIMVSELNKQSVGSGNLIKNPSFKQANWHSASGGTHGPITAKDLASGGTISPAENVATAAQTELSSKANRLPGMEVQVEYPCACKDKPISPHPNSWKGKNSIKSIIIHLNDSHHNDWTTDDICNWLDGLHDAGVVDLSMEIPDKEIENGNS